MKLFSQGAAQKLQAEIIRLKLGLKDRCLEIRTLEIDLEQWKSGFEKMAESDRLETEERIHWEERAEKAERELVEVRPTKAAIHLHLELAELRDAVAWYFECEKVEKYRTLKCIDFKSRHLDMYLGKIPMTDFVKKVRRVCKYSILELRKSLEHAKQQLRETGGENV